MKKRFGKRRTIPEVDLDITSLLDVIVIILVFLLKNYNASDLTVDLQKKIKMAESQSRNLGNMGPIIQLSQEGELYLNKEMLGNIHQGDGVVLALQAKLTALPKRQLTAKEMAKEKTRDPSHDQTHSNLINLVFDRETPYELVDKVMVTAAKTGYNQFKFIVKGNY